MKRMPRHMTLSNTDMVSSSAVVHQWKRSRLGHPLSAIDDATIQQIETANLEECRVTERQLVYEVKLSLGSVEKIYDHMHM